MVPDTVCVWMFLFQFISLPFFWYFVRFVWFKSGYPHTDSFASI